MLRRRAVTLDDSALGLADHPEYLWLFIRLVAGPPSTAHTKRTPSDIITLSAGFIHSQARTIVPVGSINAAVKSTLEFADKSQESSVRGLDLFLGAYDG
jgi:hypothetical protein